MHHDVNEIKTKIKKKKTKPNLSNGEQKTMNYLAKQKDIIITSGDKCGAGVIMDTENYIRKANRQCYTWLI